MWAKHALAGGVRHDEKLPVQDGVAAKGNVARSLGDADADLGFEPLPFFVHERDQGDGRLAYAGGEFRQVIKNLLGNGIEDIELQRTSSRLRSSFGTFFIVEIAFRLRNDLTRSPAPANGAL